MKKFWLLLAALLLVSAVCCACLADNNNMPTQPLSYGATDGQENWIAQIQNKLRDLYYLDESTQYTLGTLDYYTWQAINECCQVNGIGIDTSNGISVSVQKQLLELNGNILQPKPTPTPTPTPVVTATPSPTPVAQWSYDERLKNVQILLTNAGYLKGAEIGRLDQVTLDAINTYLSQMGWNPVSSMDEDHFALFAGVTALPTIAPTATPEPTPTPVPTMYIVPGTTNNETINVIQGKLKDNGYIVAGTYTSGNYDQYTQEALDDFCAENGIAFDAAVTQEVYDRVYAYTARDIRSGDHTASVGTMQNCLNAMGYYADLGSCTGTCDADMLKAVERFAKQNNLAFTKADGIVSVYMQTAIMNAYSATPRQTYEAESWISQEVSVAGIAMPRYVELLAILVIVFGLALLVIKTFTGSKPSGKPGSGKGIRVKVDVYYNSALMGSKTIDVFEPVHVGRGYHVIEINAADRKVSGNHFQLESIDNTLRLRDFSTNGTYVNGRKINNGMVAIQSGDRVKIGDCHELVLTVL